MQNSAEEAPRDSTLAERTQRYADTGSSRAFHEALHAVYVPSHQMQAPLRSADGSTPLADKTNILNRLAEHYGTLFNDVRSVEDASIDNIQQQPVKPELDEPPFLEEVQTAVKKMEVHKAPGIDGVPTEVYKHGGDQLIFTLCRKKGVVPGDLRDAVIVFLYKNKGKGQTVQLQRSDLAVHRGKNPSPCSTGQTQSSCSRRGPPREPGWIQCQLWHH